MQRIGRNKWWESDAALSSIDILQKRGVWVDKTISKSAVDRPFPKAHLSRPYDLFRPNWAAKKTSCLVQLFLGDPKMIQPMWSDGSVVCKPTPLQTHHVGLVCGWMSVVFLEVKGRFSTGILLKKIDKTSNLQLVITGIGWKNNIQPPNFQLSNRQILG